MEQKILESTYFHTAKITGLKEVIKEWGETVLEDGLIIDNVKCALSQDKRSFNTNTIQAQQETTISYSAKLFCNPNVSIRAGDKIEVTLENGVVRGFIAGEPFYYPSHQEIPLIRELKA